MGNDLSPWWSHCPSPLSTLPGFFGRVTPLSHPLATPQQALQKRPSMAAWFPACAIPHTLRYLPYCRGIFPGTRPTGRFCLFTLYKRSGTEPFHDRSRLPSLVAEKSSAKEKGSRLNKIISSWEAGQGTTARAPGFRNQDRSTSV